MNNYGFKNELDFVALFNNKYLEELDENSQFFLKDIFGDYINKNEKIKSWKNSLNQKTDIFIKFKNQVKKVSLKYRNKNTIHCESIDSFKSYLKSLDIPYNIISIYANFHYGYMRDENGCVILSQKLSTTEYKELYQDEIDCFSNTLNKTKIIVDMVDRFIIRGTNSNEDIDALVCGSVDDYVWLLKYDIYDLALYKRYIYFTSPHASCITMGPKYRVIKDNDFRNIKDKYYVNIRWDNLKTDIEEFKKTIKNNTR